MGSSLNFSRFFSNIFLDNHVTKCFQIQYLNDVVSFCFKFFFVFSPFYVISGFRLQQLLELSRPINDDDDDVDTSSLGTYPFFGLVFASCIFDANSSMSKIQKKSFYEPKRVTKAGAPSAAYHLSTQLRRNVAAMTSRWRHSPISRPGNRTQTCRARNPLHPAVFFFIKSRQLKILFVVYNCWY